MQDSTSRSLPKTRAAPKGVLAATAEAESVRIGAWQCPLLPLTRTSAAQQTTDVAMSDWDDLFDAITARLVSLAAGTGAGSVQRDVLECVAAMEQLHSTLTRERLRARLLEFDLIDMELEQLQLRAELAGSRPACP